MRELFGKNETCLDIFKISLLEMTIGCIISS